MIEDINLDNFFGERVEDDPGFDEYFKNHINTLADKHPTMLVRQLAKRLRSAQSNADKVEIDKPARVAGRVFRVGASMQSVVEAAQRQYEAFPAPEITDDSLCFHNTGDDSSEHYTTGGAQTLEQALAAELAPPKPNVSLSNKELHTLAVEYLDDYSYAGDGGYYNPNEFEQVLLLDAITGYIDGITDSGRGTISPKPDFKDLSEYLQQELDKRKAEKSEVIFALKSLVYMYDNAIHGHVVGDGFNKARDIIDKYKDEN